MNAAPTTTGVPGEGKSRGAESPEILIFYGFRSVSGTYIALSAVASYPGCH